MHWSSIQLPVRPVYEIGRGEWGVCVHQSVSEQYNERYVDHVGDDVIHVVHDDHHVHHDVQYDVVGWQFGFHGQRLCRCAHLERVVAMAKLHGYVWRLWSE